MVTINAIASQGNSIAVDGDNQKNSAIQQAPNIEGTNSPEILFGTSGDDIISALGGDDTVIGTTGNDTIDGGDGFDTVDYTDFGEAVTILPAGEFDNGADTQLTSIEKIIGATGQQNTINGSSVTGNTTSINVNLSNNSLIVENIPVVGSLNLEVENFTKVVGTSNSDTIVGSNANDNLSGRAGDDEITGGGGNDVLVGNRGSDRLNGTDSLLRGANERDNLFGGSDGDRFIIGDASGSFYTAAGDNDFAKVSDFSAGDVMELGRGETYSVERVDSGFNLFAEQENGKELVAKVQFSFSGIAAINSKSTNQIASDGSSSFDNQIELPTDSFQLNAGETLDIFTAA